MKIQIEHYIHDTEGCKTVEVDQKDLAQFLNNYIARDIIWTNNQADDMAPHVVLKIHIYHGQENFITLY